MTVPLRQDRAAARRDAPPRQPGIECQVGVPAQRVLPQRQQQERRCEQRQGGVDVHPAELAAFHATGQDALDQGEGPTQHGVGVELRNRGEVAGFSDHELGHRGQVAVEQLQEPLCKQPEQVGAGAGMSGELPLGHLEIWQHRLAHDCAEQVLLGGKVEVDRALADPGGGSDVLQLRRGVTAFSERGEGGSDDLAGPRVLSAGANCHSCYLLTVQSVSRSIASADAEPSPIVDRHGQCSLPLCNTPDCLPPRDCSPVP